MRYLAAVLAVLATMAGLVVGGISLVHAQKSLSTEGPFCVAMIRHHDPVFGDADSCYLRGDRAPGVMPWYSNLDHDVTFGRAH